jgi:hypothetical protein
VKGPEPIAVGDFKNPIDAPRLLCALRNDKLVSIGIVTIRGETIPSLRLTGGLLVIDETER